MKNRVILLCMFLLVCSNVFSQELEKKEPSMLLFTMGPHASLNLHKNSAPSPILFSAGFGGQIELFSGMSFTPHASFFATYYLVDNGIVYPAEIEQRKAFVPALMVDLPFTADFHFANSIVRFGGGISFLLRYAFVANGTDTFATDEVKIMNSWFWKDLEFIYPSVQISWDYIFDNGFAFGVGLKAYVPLGSLIKQANLQNGMVSISARFIPSF